MRKSGLLPLAWIALTAAAAGVAIVILNGSSADHAYPESPVVDGRLMTMVRGDNIDGPSIIHFCEFDAEVNTEGAVVAEVVAQGTGPQTKVGDFIIDVDLENKEPDWTGHYHLPVHWRDGALHAGCAPESRTIELPVIEEPVTPASAD